MDNFLGGLHAVILGLVDTLSRVTGYPLFWGFTLGFLTSTVVHALLFVDHPKHVPQILFQEPSKSFEQLASRKADGTYTKSYAEFSKGVRRTKLLFLLAGGMLLTLIIIVLITK